MREVCEDNEQSYILMQGEHKKVHRALSSSDVVFTAPSSSKSPMVKRGV